MASWVSSPGFLEWGPWRDEAFEETHEVAGGGVLMVEDS